MFKKWGCIFALICGASVFAGTGSVAETPNILFILIDDMGWVDLGCYGSQLNKTPHINRLAAEGVRFTQAYAAAHVCSPTRGSIMTGKYPARTHITDWIPGHKKKGKLQVPDWQKSLLQEEVTVGEMLQAAGYRTAWLGKWHLRGYPNGPRTDSPRIASPQQYHGFDAGTQNWLLNSGKNPDDPNGKKDPKGVDALSEQAIGFIKESGETPWFVAVSHYSVHTPVLYNNAVKDHYEEQFQSTGNQKYAGYAAMIEPLDASVGKLMDFLKSQGIEDDTLVIVSSDNGGLQQETNNEPLRAGKGTLYEGGTRVPLIARWPGRIPAGLTSDTMVSSIDFYPTFAEVAKIHPLPQTVDGISLFSHLTEQTPIDRACLYWHYPHYHAGMPGSSIRKGDYKLIEFFEDGSLELYDLRADLGEKENLASKRPELAKELHEQLVQWRKDVGAQMMTPGR